MKTKIKNVKEVLHGSLSKTSATATDKNKFKCMLCEDDVPHMVVIMNKDGNIHVHAPFENRYIMNQFIEAIVDEQKKFDSKSE